MADVQPLSVAVIAKKVHPLRSFPCAARNANPCIPGLIPEEAAERFRIASITTHEFDCAVTMVVVDDVDGIANFVGGGQGIDTIVSCCCWFWR